jgi:urea transport system ATP-binding protein
MILLQITDLDVFYADSCICNSINLQIKYNEEVCLLGRNGVGKTSLLKCIMGLAACRKGGILYRERDITHLKPYEIARLGIGYVPQGRFIFPNLSVAENLKLGLTASQGKIKKIPDSVFDYFPRLKERLKQKGGTLSGGEQQMLAIARALCTFPKLLLMDEPSEGLAAGVTKELTKIIKRLCTESEMSTLLVEQNLEMALSTVSRGYVMEKGCIVAQGDTDELRSDEIVQSHLMV